MTTYEEFERAAEDVAEMDTKYALEKLSVVIKEMQEQLDDNQTTITDLETDMWGEFREIRKEASSDFKSPNNIFRQNNCTQYNAMGLGKLE